MARNILILATALTLGLTAGSAQATDLRILRTGGENFQVDYGPNPGNVVGGGAVTTTGSGETATYTHSSALAPGPGFESITGGGNSAIIYRTRAPAAPTPVVPPR